jgi:hypothetical protein
LALLNFRSIGTAVLSVALRYGWCARAACNDLPFKPKGMHWSTHNPLVDRYEHYDTQWALAAMRRFGIKF